MLGFRVKLGDFQRARRRRGYDYLLHVPHASRCSLPLSPEICCVVPPGGHGKGVVAIMGALPAAENLIPQFGLKTGFAVVACPHATNIPQFGAFIKQLRVWQQWASTS